MPASLQITGLLRQFGRKIALNGATLSLEDGAITAILGEANSGKTTLFNIIAGFDRTYRGAVTLGRTPLDDLAPHHRAFGIVQQKEGFLPNLTLRENIALPLTLRGKRGATRDKLIDTTLDLTELTEHANLYPHQATPEILVRAALARAAAAEPRIMLIDDPLQNLSGHPRANVLAIIARLHRMLGATIALFTRDDETALTLANSIAILHRGRIIETATPDALYNHPATAQIAAMIGPASQFLGQVVDVEDDTMRIALDCGPEIEAGLYTGARAGDRCCLFLRPETLALAPQKASEMGEGAIDATIIEARATGEKLFFRLLIGSGAEIIVTRPAATGMRGLKPGNQAAIAWQPHRALVFKEEKTRGFAPGPH